MKYRFLRLLIGVILVATANGLSFGIAMKIEKIDGVSVPPGEVYIPTTTSIPIEWEESSTALGVLQLKIRVNGDEVTCPPTQCNFGVPINAGTIFLDRSEISGGCMHTVQVEGIAGTRHAFSNTESIWLDPYKECTGNRDCNKSTVGRPVDVATGEMYLEQVDLQIQGPLPIVFLRRYDNQSTVNGPLGFGWHHTFLMRIEDAGTGRKVFVDQTGRRVYFGKTLDSLGNPIWASNQIERLSLTEQATSPEWTITNRNSTHYEFNSLGQLTQIVDRNNNTIALGYKASKLTSITDMFGRTMDLVYDANDRLQTLSAGGRTVTYTYNNATDNLERVDWSDGSFVTYEYTDPNDSHNLTAARDSFANLIEGHTYDSSDRVLTTQSDAGNYAYTLVYDSATQTTVTNSLAVDAVFTHDSFNGLVTSSSGPGCTSCGGGGIDATIVHDRFLNPTSVTDAVGIVTNMTYGSDGNLETLVEAFGTPRQSTTSYTWHPTFNALETMTVPSVGSCVNADKITTYTYDNATGDRLTEQITGCDGSSPFSRTATFTYDTHGQLKTVDGPRTDVTDLTTYDYYADTNPNMNLAGRLERVTNALTHETGYAGYDLFGNVGSVTDENNVETAYLYDAKDRLTETRIKGAVPADDVVTEQVYDLEGNLDLIRHPNCVETGPSCAFSVDYTYDTVNRLKEVVDPFGNKIVYTYDTEGNRTREEYRDSISAVQKFTNFSYDDFNRTRYIYFNPIVPEAAGSVFSKYTYRDDGLRETERDPEGHVTTFGYDELKRVTSVDQTVGPDVLTTQYAYDVQDNLATVLDPNNFVTDYTNHDMGWRIQIVSPDTGTTALSYDPAGNQTAVTDARSIPTIRGYDALNRLTSVTYPDASLNVAVTYDSPAASFGVGRRTGMTDPSGTTVYEYDRRGLLEREERTIASSTFVTQYEYDKGGNLERVRYPTSDPVQRQGEASYAYDVGGRVSGVTTMANGSPTSIASLFTYKPFGPRTSVTFGNGLVDSRTYGTRYEIGNWTMGALLSYTHGFDDDLNLTSRVDNLNAANTRVLGYDEAHRLTAASGPWGGGANCTGGVTYTYDKNGNRECKGEESTVTDYNYVTGKNRLDFSTGGEVASYSYDANGNTTGDGARTYEYDDANRLATIDAGSGATYTYDGDGRRVIKNAAGVTTYFFYSPSGNLLSEIVPDPKTGKDYIYLFGHPLARVDWTTEQDMGDALRVSKASPNVHLDWSLFPSGSNDYAVRRKQVADPSDKSFIGSTVLATMSDPIQTFDDPILSDGNDYEYRVFREEVVDAVYFYHWDHLGTPIAMTDGSAALAWRIELRPFGDVHAVAANSTRNDLRFPGQYADTETDLYQNVWRNYAPGMGRYAEPDPMRNPFAVKEGLYPYVANNPVAFEDPLGLTCGSCCDTPAKIAADRDRIKKAAGLAVVRYNVAHFYVPQTRCQTYTAIVEEALIGAMPKCHDFTDVSTKGQQVLPQILMPSLDVEPAHVATIVRPCGTRRWEDGFILDAWPLGDLTEFTWDNWRPGWKTLAPTVDARLVFKGTCQGLLRP